MCGTGHQSHFSHLFFGWRAHCNLYNMRYLFQCFFILKPITRCRTICGVGHQSHFSHLFFWGTAPTPITFTYAIAFFVQLHLQAITRCKAFYVRSRSPKSSQSPLFWTGGPLLTFKCPVGVLVVLHFKPKTIQSCLCAVPVTKFTLVTSFLRWRAPTKLYRCGSYFSSTSI